MILSRHATATVAKVASPHAMALTYDIARGACSGRRVGFYALAVRAITRMFISRSGLHQQVGGRSR